MGVSRYYAYRVKVWLRPFSAPRMAGWKEIQQKVFTNWFNDRLRGNLKSAKNKVNDLKTDLQDGLLILELMEILARPRKPGRYNKNPRSKLQCIENLGIALKFIASENVKLVNIGKLAFVQLYIKK